MLDTYDYDRNPELYRARARKMRELAKDTLDEFMRAELIDLAVQFDALAETKRNADPSPS